MDYHCSIHVHRLTSTLFLVKYNCQMQLSHRKIRAPCKLTFRRYSKYKKMKKFHWAALLNICPSVGFPPCQKSSKFKIQNKSNTKPCLLKIQLLLGSWAKTVWRIFFRQRGTPRARPRVNPPGQPPCLKHLLPKMFGGILESPTLWPQKNVIGKG